ncbi:hypothetical protein F5050DRAFT_1791533 [Lentinula boryana]|uniref:Uncharacterized protein n=1 Tax=Lentinula boryana TaxID=40481 RepID=A0ABQ8Q000_9AGAR|nr:hypothetical protein F5050DRAFT_1791533 [Lentinula boryana]
MVKPAETSLLSSPVNAYVNASMSLSCPCPCQRLSSINLSTSLSYNKYNKYLSSLPSSLLLSPLPLLPFSYLFISHPLSNSIQFHPMQNTSMKPNPINPVNRVKTNPINPDRRHLPPGWKETYNAQCVFVCVSYPILFHLLMVIRQSLFERYMVSLSFPSLYPSLPSSLPSYSQSFSTPYSSLIPNSFTPPGTTPKQPPPPLAYRISIPRLSVILGALPRLGLEVGMGRVGRRKRGRGREGVNHPKSKSLPLLIPLPLPLLIPLPPLIHPHLPSLLPLPSHPISVHHHHPNTPFTHLPPYPCPCPLIRPLIRLWILRLIRRRRRRGRWW